MEVLEPVARVVWLTPQHFFRYASIEKPAISSLPSRVERELKAIERVPKKQKDNQSMPSQLEPESIRTE